VTPALPAPADYPGCPVTVTEAIAAGRSLRPPRWGLWDVFWALMAAIFIGVGVGAILFFADASLGWQILVGTTVPWLAFAGWPIIATRRRGNGPVIDLGLRLTWQDAGWGVLGGVASVICAAIAASITTRFAPDVSSAAGDAADQLVKDGNRATVVLFALIVMVGAPVVEELFFRGLFFGAVRKRGVGTVLTVVITAVVFAGFHFEPVRFFILLPTGLILGWVRAKTGSTGASMVAHGLVNAPGALLVLLGGPGMSP
jgi:membrane protease YdiL (CAAX protease family)